VVDGLVDVAQSVHVPPSEGYSVTTDPVLVRLGDGHVRRLSPVHSPSVQSATIQHQSEPMAEMLPQGRVFSLTRRPLLGDCAPSGRVRLDAIARWLQDVAYTDVEDAGLHEVADDRAR